VFNSDIKTLRNQVFNVTVNFEKKYFLAVDQDLKTLELQSIPIFFFDKYHKAQYQNLTHADMAFLVPHIGPFQLLHVYLFEFLNYKECLVFYGNYLHKEGLMSESACLTGKPSIYQASKSSPKIQI